MTAHTLIDGLTPSTEPDTARVRTILAYRFPDAVVWFGTFTRQWWAMVCTGGRWRLVVASGPEELTRAIISAQR